MNIVNKNFKENSGLKKFIDESKTIDESFKDNDNNNYNIHCNADETNVVFNYNYNTQIRNNKNKHNNIYISNNNNYKTNNNLLGNKKASLKTTALNRVNKSTDLDEHLKNYKANNLKEDFSINDLINKSNEDFIKMRIILEKNSNKNSKKNFIDNSGINIPKKIENCDSQLFKKDDLFKINENKNIKNPLNKINQRNYIDSGNANINSILNDKTFLKLDKINSKNYENARKKARNNFNKNNCSIPTEILEFDPNEAAYISLDTEVKNRPKSNLGYGEFHTYYNSYKYPNCIYEERVNTINEFSSSKNYFYL
jgi:hypothetical protein